MSLGLCILTSKDASTHMLGLVVSALAEAVGMPERVEQLAEFPKAI